MFISALFLFITSVGSRKGVAKCDTSRMPNANMRTN